MKRRDIIVGCLLLSMATSGALYHTNSKSQNYANIKTEYKVGSESYNEFLEVVKVEKEKRIAEEQERIRQEEERKRIEAERQRLEAMNVVFDINDLRKPSNLTITKAKSYLGNTTMAGLEEAFIDAEKETGVNAIFLVGLVANESGWNDSPRSKNGSNNLTGHAVYTRESRGSQFDSKYECIMETARMIKKDYLSPKGTYYNGVSLLDVNQSYSIDGGQPNKEWYYTIKSISTRMSRVLNSR